MKVRMAPPRLDALDELGPESLGTLVLTSFADDRPLRGLTGLVDWRLNGQLSRLLQREFVDAHWQEATLAPVPQIAGGPGRLPFDRLLLVGMGRRAEFQAQRFEDVCRFCFRTLADLGVLHFAMSLPGRVGLDVGLRQALAGWRRALAESFTPAQLATVEVCILETPEVQRELAEPMRALVKELERTSVLG